MNFTINLKMLFIYFLGILFTQIYNFSHIFSNIFTHTCVYIVACKNVFFKNKKKDDLEYNVSRSFQ